MAYIPMVLIMMVLSKLPVKSLLRFLCVCKSWHSLIKDPYFIKLHLKHSIENYTNQAIIMRDFYLYSLDYPTLNEVTFIDHPIMTPSYSTLLLGSCNGLLCLSNDTDDKVKETIFYNPVTRKHHELPATPLKFTGESAKVYGFGYDAVNDDYKLVRIIVSYGEDDEYDCEVKVYSLKSDYWKTISDFPRFYYLYCNRGGGLYVSGCLHWVVAQISDSYDIEYIIAFDLGSEEYRIVSLPENLEGEYLDGEFDIHLGVLKGCLSVFCDYPDVKSDVWIMGEYGVRNSWTKLFSIANGGIMGSFDYVRPIAFSNDGLRVLVEKDGKRTFWFDLASQTVENVEVRGLPALYDYKMIVESLVPLESHQKKNTGEERAA